MPLRRILESKVSKAGNGFYGQFDKMGLFVFSHENLSGTEAVKALKYTISLQKYQDIKYNRLYLADVNDLFVCNLDDGLSDDFFRSMGAAWCTEKTGRSLSAVQTRAYMLRLRGRLEG